MCLKDSFLAIAPFFPATEFKSLRSARSVTGIRKISGSVIFFVFLIGESWRKILLTLLGRRRAGGLVPLQNRGCSTVIFETHAKKWMSFFSLARSPFSVLGALFSCYFFDFFIFFPFCAPRFLSSSSCLALIL